MSTSEKILIDSEAFRTASDLLQEGITEFEPFGDGYIGDIRELLSTSDSEFISAIDDTLNTMEDTKAPELINNLKTFHRYLNQVLDEMIELDAVLVKKEG